MTRNTHALSAFELPNARGLRKASVTVHLSPHVVLTEVGDYVQSFKLAGAYFESAAVREILDPIYFVSSRGWAAIF